MLWQWSTTSISLLGQPSMFYPKWGTPLACQDPCCVRSGKSFALLSLAQTRNPNNQLYIFKKVFESTITLTHHKGIKLKHCKNDKTMMSYQETFPFERPHAFPGKNSEVYHQQFVVALLEVQHPTNPLKVMGWGLSPYPSTPRVRDHVNTYPKSTQEW